MVDFFHFDLTLNLVLWRYLKFMFVHQLMVYTDVVRLLEAHSMQTIVEIKAQFCKLILRRQLPQGVVLLIFVFCEPKLDDNVVLMV